MLEAEKVTVQTKVKSDTIFFSQNKKEHFALCGCVMVVIQKCILPVSSSQITQSELDQSTFIHYV